MNSRLSKRKGRASEGQAWTGKLKSRAPRGILSCSLCGFGIAIAVGICLLLALSAVIYSTNDPNRFVSPASLSVLYISSLFGGFSAARLNRGSALLCGLLSSCMLLAILFLTSLFVEPSPEVDTSLVAAIGQRGIAVGISVLGAAIGVSNQKKRPKRR